MSLTKKRINPLDSQEPESKLAKKISVPASETMTVERTTNDGDEQDCNNLGAVDKNQEYFDAIVSQLSLGRDTDRIVIKESRIANAGLGVFAATELKKNEPITQYCGLSRTKQESVDMIKRDAESASHMRTHFSMRHVIDGRFLPDGTPITDGRTQFSNYGVGAMLNHSNTPNCDFDRVDNAEQCAAMGVFMAGGPSNFLPKNRVVYIRAIADIAKDEELTVNYGADYWKRKAKKVAGNN